MDAGAAAAAKAKAEAATAKAKADAKIDGPPAPAGFVALAQNDMSWEDAQAYCTSKGGRLPLINGSASWDGKGAASADGFGVSGSPWPAGLPTELPNCYWTGTNDAGSQRMRFVFGDDKVGFGAGRGMNCRVACVPK
jgi:formylglycine-generating enzyme required for sulfatase activity